MSQTPEERRTLELVLVWTTLAAAVADSSLTYVGLRWLAGAEGSAVVRLLIARFGLAGGLLIRTIIVAALVAVVWKVVTVSLLRLVGLVIIAVINVGVIGWNLAVM